MSTKMSSTKSDKTYTVTLSFEMKRSDLEKMLTAHDPSWKSLQERFFQFLSLEPTDATSAFDNMGAGCPEPEEVFQALWDDMRDEMADEEEEERQMEEAAAEEDEEDEEDKQ